MTEEKKTTLDVIKIRRNLNNKYPIGYIPRQEIREATGGILIPKTMSNRDTEDEGISGAVKISGKICYPIDNVINYLEEKTKILDVA